jgi:hypothetical protein
MASCMSDPDHFDHILPFLQPADVPHKIDLTAADVLRMHKEDFKSQTPGACRLYRLPHSHAVVS